MDLVDAMLSTEVGNSDGGREDEASILAGDWHRHSPNAETACANEPIVVRDFGQSRHRATGSLDPQSDGVEGSLGA